MCGGLMNTPLCTLLCLDFATTNWIKDKRREAQKRADARWMANSHSQAQSTRIEALDLRDDGSDFDPSNEGKNRKLSG